MYTLAFLRGVLLTGLAKLVMYGVDGLIYYLLNEAVFSIFTVLLVDFLVKFATDKSLITWQYWVMDVFMVLAVLSYAGASLMTTVGPMWAFLIGTISFIAAAGVWCNKMYKPSVAKKAQEVYDAAVNSVIEKAGVPRATAEAVTDYFVEVK